MLLFNLGFMFDANALLTAVLATCDRTITAYLWGSRSFSGSIILPRWRQDMAQNGFKSAQDDTYNHQGPLGVDTDLPSWVHFGCECSADNCSANMRPHDHHLPMGFPILSTPGDILGPSWKHLGAILELSFVHLASYRPSDVNKPPGLPMIAPR